MEIKHNRMQALLNTGTAHQQGLTREADDQRAMKDDKLKKSCAEFEGVLLNYMFKSMKKTVGGSGVTGNSYQKEMYESIFFEEVAREVAREKGMGIGDALYRQLAGRSAAPSVAKPEDTTQQDERPENSRKTIR